MISGLSCRGAGIRGRARSRVLGMAHIGSMGASGRDLPAMAVLPPGIPCTAGCQPPPNPQPW